MSTVEGTGTASRPRTTGRVAAGRRRRFLPPQHGAWAMLAVPYLAGLLAAGYRWADAALAGAWLAGYLLSYYLFQSVKSRRPGRYRAQLLLYAAVAAPLAALVVAARPQVLWYAPGYAALLAVNAWYAARRRERALLNDVASVLQSCLVVLVVATIAGTVTAAALVAFLLCLAYFLGTVFYVKTMIRERGNPRYRRWSAWYHVLALAAAAAQLVAAAPSLRSTAATGPWAAALFAWLLARAVVLPGRGLAPKRVGLIEMANCAALLAIVALR